MCKAFFPRPGETENSVRRTSVRRRGGDRLRTGASIPPPGREGRGGSGQWRPDWGGGCTLRSYIFIPGQERGSAGQGRVYTHHQAAYSDLGTRVYAPRLSTATGEVRERDAQSLVPGILSLSTATVISPQSQTPRCCSEFPVLLPAPLSLGCQRYQGCSVISPGPNRMLSYQSQAVGGKPEGCSVPSPKRFLVRGPGDAQLQVPGAVLPQVTGCGGRGCTALGSRGPQSQVLRGRSVPRWC